MSALAGQTTVPNGLTFFLETPRGVIGLNLFFKIVFYSTGTQASIKSTTKAVQVYKVACVMNV